MCFVSVRNGWLYNATLEKHRLIVRLCWSGRRRSDQSHRTARARGKERECKRRVTHPRVLMSNAAGELCTFLLKRSPVHIAAEEPAR